MAKEKNYIDEFEASLIKEKVSGPDPIAEFEQSIRPSRDRSFYPNIGRQTLLNEQAKNLEEKLSIPEVSNWTRPLQETTSKIAEVPLTAAKWILGPAGEAANRLSNLVQGKPQEELISPLEHPIDYANKYGTSEALMRTLPVGNEPLIDSEYLKKEFPVAERTIGQITPNILASQIADISALSKIPMPKASIRPSISLETAADYVRSLAKNKSQLLELETSGKIYRLAKMVQKNPEAYLHPFKPNKIYEHLQGDIMPEVARRDIGTGAIGKETELQNQFIEGLPRTTYSIPREELQLAAKKELGGFGALEEGQRASAEGFIERNIPFTPADEAKIAKIKSVQSAQSQLEGMGTQSSELPPDPSRIKLERYIKENFDPSAPDIESYVDMIRSRNEEPAGFASSIRRLGNKLQEPLAPGEVSTDIGAKNLAGRAMERAARSSQEQVMGSEGVPEQSVTDYNLRNKEISDMIAMRDLMQGNFVADSTSAEFLPTGMTGRSGGVGYVAKTLNRYLKPTLSKPYGKAMDVASMAGSQVQAPMIAGQSRELMMNVPLPMQLVKYQIPRNSSQILANKDIVIAKIAQMSDNPQLVEQFTDALNEHPEKLPKVLPALIMQFPDLFEPDDYNRVDGHIFDPMLKQKALKDIRNNKIMSLREKTFKSKRLDMEGILE